MQMSPLATVAYITLSDLPNCFAAQDVLCELKNKGNEKYLREILAKAKRGATYYMSEATFCEGFNSDDLNDPNIRRWYLDKHGYVLLSDDKLSEKPLTELPHWTYCYREVFFNLRDIMLFLEAKKRIEEGLTVERLEQKINSLINTEPFSADFTEVKAELRASILLWHYMNLYLERLTNEHAHFELFMSTFKEWSDKHFGKAPILFANFEYIYSWYAANNRD